jgi:DNA-binding MarR family transcriptional regulator
MTRYLHSIGDQARGGGSGLGLITIKRITGSRNKTEIYLTEKGRAVAAEVFGNLRRLVEVRK